MNRTKKGTVFFLFLAGILMCFCSCATSGTARKKQLSVLLTGDSRFILLSPDNIEAPIDDNQIVTASYGGNSYRMNAWVKADETGIDMTLINELGANMGELSYREGAVSFSTPLLPKFIGGEYIVADFQFCFYNIPALRGALESCGLSLVETKTGHQILDGKNLVIEIEKRPKLVKLVNHVRGYSYTLAGNFQ